MFKIIFYYIIRCNIIHRNIYFNKIYYPGKYLSIEYQNLLLKIVKAKKYKLRAHIHLINVTLN